MNRVASLGMVSLLVLGVSAQAVLAFPSRQTPTESEQAQAAFKKGYHHQKAGRYQEAIEAYEKSLKHDPKQAEALNNVGFCYKSLKRYQKAIGFYKEALSINPQLAEAHEYLGEAYLAIGKRELAQREYQALLELDPKEAHELKEQLDAARGVKKPE